MARLVATADELIAASMLFTLASKFNLTSRLLELLRQYYIYDSEVPGYRCRICNYVIPEDTPAVNVRLCIHLFREHPDKYYRIEEQLLEIIRSRLEKKRLRGVLRLVSKLFRSMQHRLPAVISRGLLRLTRRALVQDVPI